MADRNNHYEIAFEQFLRGLRIAPVAIDETRRMLGDDATVKNLDYIVPLPNATFLIDVKGRRRDGQRGGLENWCTKDDLLGLEFWRQRFGPRSIPLLAFVYHLSSESGRIDFEDSFSHADRHYGCLVMAVDDYRDRMRTRSPRWGTVSVPRGLFREHARPMTHWLKRAAEAGVAG